MSVRQFPGEPTRFLVQSGRDPAQEYVIDVAWQPNPNDKPKVQCGCLRHFAAGKPCRHILALANYLNHEITTQTNP